MTTHVKLEDKTYFLFQLSTFQSKVDLIAMFEVVSFIVRVADVINGISN